MSTLDITVL